MKKIFLTSIFLIFLFFPINSFGQFLDPIIMEEIIEEEETDQEIVLHTLELHWSTDTYTPSNYQGRKLPSKGSLVNVYVDIKISGEDPQALKYSWFLDDVFQEMKSGYGRDSFDFGVRRYGGTTHSILLKVFNESRSFIVEKSMKIPITNSEVFLYPFQNNYFLDQANESYFVVSGEKSTFLAKPYFFDVKKITDLNFKWSIHGQAPLVSSGYTSNVLGLTLTKQDEETMEKRLEIEVDKKIGNRQTASKKINIQIY